LGTTSDHKQNAIDLWNDRPSAVQQVPGEPGTRAYIEALLDGSDAYAPWLRAQLGVDDARGLRVLDVGCGAGVQVAAFARAGADAHGLDLVPEHVRQAEAHLRALELPPTVVVGDAEDLPYEDASFDRVVSLNALQFTPDIGRALREIRRVLRDGGDARIVVYHRDSAYFWLHIALWAGVVRGGLRRHRSLSEVLSRELPWSRDVDPPAARAFSRRRMRALLREAGFRDADVGARGFAPEHLAPYAAAATLVPALARPHVLERMGRAAGWYLVVRAIR
jgi:SAM-dependent methyltransferase